MNRRLENDVLMSVKGLAQILSMDEPGSCNDKDCRHVHTEVKMKFNTGDGVMNLMAMWDVTTARYVIFRSTDG